MFPFLIFDELVQMYELKICFVFFKKEKYLATKFSQRYATVRHMI